MKKSILLVFVLAFCLVTEQAKADFTFGTPVQLDANINSTSGELGFDISSDGLSLYFASNRGNSSLDFDIYVSTRASEQDPWGPATKLGMPISTLACEVGPCISDDRLSLFFNESLKPFTVTYRPGGYGDSDIWMATRATTADPWGEPINAGPRVNTAADEGGMELSADGLSLFFSSDRPGGSGDIDLWVATRPTRNVEWGDPMNLGPIVNSAQSDGTPSLSMDGLHLFFHSNRPPSQAAHQVDLYLTSRHTVSDPWEPPIRLGPPVNTMKYWECGPRISSDARTLYLVADNWPGRFSYYDIWSVPVLPVVDFNRDGIVDCADMCIMVEHWGENYSLCDIGPTPLGDGIVDVQDLIVLAEHLFEEIILPPELMAYWKLDESEGSIAEDRAGDNDGILFGESLWQLDGGRKAGALQLDGIDDYMSTAFVLNPADGPFSVFAWIKGGSSGQVIISQTDGFGSGETWLGITASDGNLMTGLVPPKVGRSVIFPLESLSLITDGFWHHVGFVWDGAYRSLYVDGTEVAKDTATQNPMKSATSGLYIGAGKNLEAVTFFSGLIDDVRIYNKALSAEEIATLAQ
jgi:hypothetical protein